MSSSKSLKSSSNQPARKITRNRPTKSCSECSRRKQKCNKIWPCNHCLGRKTPHLCHYSNARSGTQSAASVTNPELEMTAEASDYNITIDSSETVLSSILIEETTVEQHYVLPSPKDPRRTGVEVLKHLPPRKTVDLLVQHYLTEVNWLYEEIHAPSFLQRYDLWWSLPHYQGDEDVQFGVWILRICVKALQVLPHSNGPSISQLSNDKSFEQLQHACSEAASKLDSYRPRKPSLLRVQQLLLEIVVLLNDGNAKESHQILGEAIKEAKCIELFLESKWIGLSEFEKEVRRRVFWYLYVWDRFHCTFLGRWPLIPDGYHSVQVPSEAPYIVSPLIGAPTIFTDVKLIIKLNHHLASFMSAPTKEIERADPYLVAAHAKDLESKFMTMVPPCYRFENPDTSWDSIIPTIPKKRLSLHLTAHAVIESMHKCFVGPLTANSVKPYLEMLKQDKAKAKLIRSLRHTLAITCIKCLRANTELHRLMGGGSHKYFVLSICVIEVAAVLGMMIISDDLLASSGIASDDLLPLLEQDVLVDCHRYFQDAMRLHQLLSQRSALAQKGSRILQSLSGRIRTSNILNKQTATKASDGDLGLDITDTHSSQVVVDATNSISTILSNNVGDGQQPQDFLDPGFLELEWEAICHGGDFSWFFDDQNGFGDGFESFTWEGFSQ